MVTLAHCQDHILTENIWFVWSKTPHSEDERRCYRCGTTNNVEDRATQPIWMIEAETIQFDMLVLPIPLDVLV